MAHAEAVEFFADLFGGVHHIPGSRYGSADNVKSRGDGWYVINSGDLATYDGDVLTRFVFLAHDRCCRGNVEASGKNLKLTIWKRENREGGPMWSRHPTLEAAVEAWRK